MLSLREDALASLDFFKAQVPNMLGNRLRLEHLDRTAARQAILGPIGAYNGLARDCQPMEIEPDLVEGVLDQVAVGFATTDSSGEAAPAASKSRHPTCSSSCSVFGTTRSAWACTT